MIEGIISILVVIFGIVGVLFKKRYSDKSIEDRKDRERDKELVQQNSPAISRRLSSGLDRMRKRNK
jgi:hypothetical protein